MQLKYCSRSIFSFLLMLPALMSSNATALEGDFNVGLNSGVYSDAEHASRNSQGSYTRLSLGYDSAHFISQAVFTQSAENDRTPYLGLVEGYDLQVAKEYYLRPVVGLYFLGGEAKPDLGLELHYSLSKNANIYFSNNYRYQRDYGSYFFGLGFEYHFISESDVSDTPSVSKFQEDK